MRSTSFSLPLPHFTTPSKSAATELSASICNNKRAPCQGGVGRGEKDADPTSNLACEKPIAAVAAERWQTGWREAALFRTLLAGKRSRPQLASSHCVPTLLIKATAAGKHQLGHGLSKQHICEISASKLDETANGAGATQLKKAVAESQPEHEERE